MLVIIFSLRLAAVVSAGAHGVLVPTIDLRGRVARQAGPLWGHCRDVALRIRWPVELWPGGWRLNRAAGPHGLGCDQHPDGARILRQDISPHEEGRGMFAPIPEGKEESA
jgi:hypothetical protein